MFTTRFELFCEYPIERKKRKKNGRKLDYSVAILQISKLKR